MFDFKIVFMLMFSIMLAMLGCSAKDVELTNQEKLIGKWYEIYEALPIQYYIDENGEKVETVLGEFALEFKPDGTFMPENGRPAKINRGGQWSMDEDGKFVHFELETSFLNVFGHVEINSYEILELTERYLHVIYHHSSQIGSSEPVESHIQKRFERRD